jgi:hypothetical protein
MAKRQKNRHYNGQKTEEQTIQWPKEKGQTTIYSPNIMKYTSSRAMHPIV